MASSRSEDFFETLVAHSDALTEALHTQAPPCGMPVYASLDLRDSGWKTCVVDVNLFPAGFNNLSPDHQSKASDKMREFFSARLLKAGPWKITVVPEAHTNNQGYLQNLTGIIKILEASGAQVKLLWPGEPSIPKAWTLKTADGKELVYLPPAEALEGSDALLLNHDLSGGVPKSIQNVHLPTFPSLSLGWYRRRKSKHFEIVDSILAKLQKKFEFFDPWYFSLKSSTIDHVIFDKDEDLKRLADLASDLLKKLAVEYREREISEKPYLIVKNDAGTYGMGVLAIQDSSELLEASSNMKKKMRKGKESQAISAFILQEGVPTALTYKKPSGETVAAEPTLYLVNGIPIGGFLRIHEKLGDRAAYENLNQPGSLLEAFESREAPSKRPFPPLRGHSPGELCSVRQTYGFIARLHAVAAGLEECPQ